MTTSNTPTRRYLLHVASAELRDTIRITIDRELIDELDRQRGSAPRSQYVEMVLAAALSREHPHLPEHWTPESAAEARAACLRRYLETGR